jgi:hypothetical protein
MCKHDINILVKRIPKDNERNQEQQVSLIPFIFAIPRLKLASIGLNLFQNRPYTSKQETQPNRNQNKIFCDFGMQISDFGILSVKRIYNLLIINPKSEIHIPQSTIFILQRHHIHH